MRNLFVPLFALALPLQAQSLERVRVSVENLAPVQGTFQTPLWVGFHDGTFDLYDRGAPVFGPGAPVGNDAVERLAEDGDTSFLAAEFLASGAGTVEGTIPSTSGPYGPGSRGSASFLLDPNAPQSSYFSYASMVIPSNDAFLANGDPLAHPIFRSGAFVPTRFFPAPVLDAGTEVNDEVPANTAFLAQAAPNTGVDENGVVTVHPGFLPSGANGILDNSMFSQGQFTDPGYPTLKIRIESAPAITEDRDHVAILRGGHEVPPVRTNARGFANLSLENDGTNISFELFVSGLGRSLTMIHLHAGAAGENGPVVVDLLASANRVDSAQRLSGSFDANALVGPLEAKPLDALAAMMEAGEIYVNVHTTTFASGELRGQVQLQ